MYSLSRHSPMLSAQQQKNPFCNRHPSSHCLLHPSGPGKDWRFFPRIFIKKMCYFCWCAWLPASLGQVWMRAVDVAGCFS